MTATRGLWLALYAATHDRYPHLAAHALAARDALPDSPAAPDLTPSATPTEICPQNDERTTT